MSGFWISWRQPRLNWVKSITFRPFHHWTDCCHFICCSISHCRDAQRWWTHDMCMWENIYTLHQRKGVLDLRIACARIHFVTEWQATWTRRSLVPSFVRTSKVRTVGWCFRIIRQNVFLASNCFCRFTVPAHTHTHTHWHWRKQSGTMLGWPSLTPALSRNFVFVAKKRWTAMKIHVSCVFGCQPNSHLHTQLTVESRQHMVWLSGFCSVPTAFSTKSLSPHYSGENRCNQSWLFG